MTAHTTTAAPTSTEPTTAGRQRRAVAVRGWAVAVSVYVLAVFHRSSLGVAGLQAEQRFGISAGQLSVFVLLQLGVYAAMQIPTGVLVDRFGPRRLLLVAGSVMAAAQVLFAVAPSYPTALLARAMLGLGDALTFVSVLRFAAANFGPRRYPVVVAVTSLLGQSGSLVATIPLSIALSRFGWTASFAAAGSVSLIAGAAVWLILPRAASAPASTVTLGEMRVTLVRVLGRVSESWSRPGTRLGFWVHFSCMSASATFSVLWGFPYLVTGLGFSHDAASTTLLCGVGTSIAASVVVGTLTSRRPVVRVPLAIGVCLLSVLGWLVMLAMSPESVPHGYAVAVVCVMFCGGPVSGVAFALARDYNRSRIIGTATGVVNVGGFAATIVISVLIGVLLDIVGSTPAGFRVAMLALVGVQVVGTVQLVRWWLRSRRFVLERQRHGQDVPVHLVEHRFDLS